MTGLYSDQTKHTKLNVDIRTTIPDVITLGQRFDKEVINQLELVKYIIMIIQVQLEHQC